MSPATGGTAQNHLRCRCTCGACREQCRQRCHGRLRCWQPLWQVTQLECCERVCRLIITKVRWRKMIGTASGVANPDRVTACPGRSCRAGAQGRTRRPPDLHAAALRSCESLLYGCTPVASCMPKDMHARSGQVCKRRHSHQLTRPPRLRWRLLYWDSHPCPSEGMVRATIKDARRWPCSWRCPRGGEHPASRRTSQPPFKGPNRNGHECKQALMAMLMAVAA